MKMHRERLAVDRRLQIEEPLEPFNLDRMPKKSCGVNEPLGSFIITTYICILGSPWVLVAFVALGSQAARLGNGLPPCERLL